MHKSPFHALLAFVECERILYQYEQEIGHQRRALEKLLQQKDHEHMQIDAIKTQANTLHKMMLTLELEGRSLREREKQVKRKLDLVKQEKEFFALKKEQEDLATKQEDTENAFLTAMQQLETTNEQYEKAVRDTVAWFEQQNQLIEALQQKIQQMVEQLEHLKNECVQRREEAPATMRDEYETMKQQIRNPYVPLSGNNCSACHTEAPKKDITSLRKNILVPCTNCYRMLYLPS